MKLNYRDKVILGILLAVVILLIGFFLLIKPKSQDIKDNKAILSEKESEKADIDARIAKIDPTIKNIEDTYAETIKLSADFVPIENIETPMDLDQYMQEYAEECEIKVRTLEVGEADAGDVNYYYYVPNIIEPDQRYQADLNGEQAIEDALTLAESAALALRSPETVIETQYAISATGTKENLWKYLQAIEDLEKTVIVDSVSVSDWTFGAETEETVTDADGNTSTVVRHNDNGESSVQIIVNLYSVYELAKPDTSAD